MRNRKYLVQRPAITELESAQWQSTVQNVFFYPEITTKLVITAQLEKVKEKSRKSDMISAFNGRSEDEIALLNQLKILPSETAINYKTVASELTCKFCSTIIYGH